MHCASADCATGYVRGFKLRAAYASTAVWSIASPATSTSASPAWMATHCSPRFRKSPVSAGFGLHFRQRFELCARSSRHAV